MGPRVRAGKGGGYGERADRAVHAYEFRKYRSRAALQRARTHDEWTAAGAALDRLHRKDAWRAQHDSPFYDAPLIRMVTRNLRRQLMEGRLSDLQQTLLTACKNNLGGVENELLYSHTYVGTKQAVQDYVDHVVAAIDTLAHVEFDNKAAFVRRLGKSYGRTALCLSGGAAFGYYHLGAS